jgi:hypothetical protein
VHGLTSFNLLGGYVEFDMDNSGATPHMNNNFYTISPDHAYQSYNDYCDGQGPYASSPTGTYCMELDIIEANGHCTAATTWHNWFNMDGDCDRAGCSVRTDIGGRFHVKAMFGEDGFMHTYFNGVEATNFGRHPSGNAVKNVQETLSRVGAKFESTQWYGWVPGDCGDSGKQPGSTFSISNLVVSGTVVMGPEPTRCEGPQPSPDWEEHASTNCYEGHGSPQEVDKWPGLAGVTGLAACQAACVAYSGCSAVTLGGSGECYRHTGSLMLSECESDVYYTTYLRTGGFASV